MDRVRLRRLEPRFAFRELGLASGERAFAFFRGPWSTWAVRGREFGPCHLMEAPMDELREIAGHAFQDERRNHTLQPLGVPAPDAVAFDHAFLDLERRSPRQCRVAELRLLVGLNLEEIAAVLDVSPATVSRDWKVALLFLRGQWQP